MNRSAYFSSLTYQFNPPTKTDEFPSWENAILWWLAISAVNLSVKAPSTENTPTRSRLKERLANERSPGFFAWQTPPNPQSQDLNLKILLIHWSLVSLPFLHYQIGFNL